MTPPEPPAHTSKHYSDFRLEISSSHITLSAHTDDVKRVFFFLQKNIINFIFNNDPHS